MPQQPRLIPIAWCFALALACATIAGCGAAPRESNDTDGPVSPEPFGEQVRDREAAPLEIADGADKVVAQPSYGVDPASIASAYDLGAILSLDPAETPATLERLGFEYEIGVPIGAWKSVSADTPLSPADSTTRLHTGVGGGETTPDLMLEGRRPGAISMNVTAPLASEEEAETVCASLLEAAGCEGELSRTVVDNYRFNRHEVTRIGACPEGGAGVLWRLDVWSQRLEGESSSYSSTTYSLAFYTRDGVLSSRDTSLMEAIGIYEPATAASAQG